MWISFPHLFADTSSRCTLSTLLFHRISTSSTQYIEPIYFIHKTVHKTIHKTIHLSTTPLWVIRFSTPIIHKLSAFPHYDSCTVTYQLLIHTKCGKLIHILTTIHRLDAHYPQKLSTTFPHYRFDISNRYILYTFLSTSYPLIHNDLSKLRVLHNRCG